MGRRTATRGWEDGLVRARHTHGDRRSTRTSRRVTCAIAGTPQRLKVRNGVSKRGRDALVTGVERYRIVEEAGRTAVYLAGEFDLANRDVLRRCLAALRGRVVADLVDVSFLDSSTIGILIGAQ